MKTGVFSASAGLLALSILCAAPARAAVATTSADSYNFGDAANQSQMALSYGVALTGTLAARAAKLELTDSLFVSTLVTLAVLTTKELTGERQPTAGAHLANAIGVGANVLVSSVIRF